MFTGTWSSPGNCVRCWDTGYKDGWTKALASGFPVWGGRADGPQTPTMQHQEGQAQVTAGPEPGKDSWGGFMASLSWTSVGLVLSPFQLQHAPAVLKPGGWVLDLSIPSGAEPKRHPSAEDANIMQCVLTISC